MALVVCSIILEQWLVFQEGPEQGVQLTSTDTSLVAWLERGCMRCHCGLGGQDRGLGSGQGELGGVEWLLDLHLGFWRKQSRFVE